MAKKKKAMAADDVIGDLIGDLNKHSTSSDAYLQGDHATHTWGVEIPYLAFQWLVGGSSILPCQRFFGVSGQEKSYKSTLSVEIGNWFIQQGGVHLHLDTENKTSPTMLDAMSWWNGVDYSRRIYKVCRSIGEWQTMVTRMVEQARKVGARAKGERIPYLCTVDSLMARSTDEADYNLRKEGAAAERGFPVSSLQVTNFLETLNLLGTTTALSWVQHMKQSMDQTGYGTKYKEKGASAAQFHGSTHLRVGKGSPFRKAKDSSAPFEGATVEGFELWLSTARTCLGPGDHRLMVPLCWQHVPQEDGSTRQAMWFDWYGALGHMLVQMKYNADFKPKMFSEDKARLENALSFTESARKNNVTCKELGLEGASYYDFGKAIEENAEIRSRIAHFLSITQFPTVQEAEIDFEAGRALDKRGKEKKG